jgi:type IV pilus assembly protein PilC
MPIYHYKAINQSGHAVTGQLEADTAETASGHLASMGLIPDRVTEKGTGGGFSDWLQRALTPVKPLDLILFTKQFRTMVKAGVPIVHLLQVLENQTENPSLERTIAKMASDIQTGAGLNESFRKHPKIFSYLYCSMIEAGEKSGSLVAVLDRLIYIIEHENKVKEDVKAALRYPMFVFLFLCVAFVVLLTFVMPRFVSIFSKAGLNLPLPTRICLELHHFMAGNWVFVLLAIVGIGLFLALYIKTPGGRLVRDALMLRLPLLGPVFQKAAMSRFGSIFSILQASGVSVLESMEIMGGTIGNTAISRQLTRIRDLMAEGQGISAPLKSSKYFPPMVIHMVAVGEESGNLDELMKEMSDHYDAEVGYAMKKLSDSIGPILTIALAVVVGFFALAIFLPMWDLTKLVK